MPRQRYGATRCSAVPRPARADLCPPRTPARGITNAAAHQMLCHVYGASGGVRQGLTQRGRSALSAALCANPNLPWSDAQRIVDAHCSGAIQHAAARSPLAQQPEAASTAARGVVLKLLRREGAAAAATADALPPRAVRPVVEPAQRRDQVPPSTRRTVDAPTLQRMSTPLAPLRRRAPPSSPSGSAAHGLAALAAALSATEGAEARALLLRARRDALRKRVAAEARARATARGSRVALLDPRSAGPAGDALACAECAAAEAEMEWEARLLLAGRAAVRAEEAAQQLRSRCDAEVVPLRAKLDQPAALTLDEFLAAVAVVEAGTGGAATSQTWNEGGNSGRRVCSLQ